MQLDELKTFLQAKLPLDLDALYSAFLTQRPQGTTEQFLTHLRDKKLIDEALLIAIHAQSSIELTMVESSGNTDLKPQASLSTPTDSSHYQLLGLLGKGAMGEVHLAKDIALQRKVAYKHLLPEVMDNRVLLGRFLNEVQITSQLDHPNIVPVYDLERTADGSLAYSMKMVQGQTLKDLIQTAQASYKAGKKPDVEHNLTTLLGYFLKVCEALDFAHNKGVIHRDLKPANLMIGSYHEVYVMDWGIARLIHHKESEIPDEWVVVGDPDSDEPAEERTQMGQIVGTPRYMSPQQAAGLNQELDARSDQFALGLILFELVSLKPAFKGKSMVELLKKVLKAQKEPFSHLSPKMKIPVELQAIVTKATSQKPVDRYESVAALAADLRRYLRGEAVLAQQDSFFRKILRWMAHHQQATLIVLMLIVMTCAGGTIASFHSRQQVMAAVQARERKLGQFLTLVANQSRFIDGQFLSLQTLLQGFEGAASQALAAQALTEDFPYFLNTGFSYAKHQPTDFTYASRYGKMVSLQWPVYKLTPTTLLPDVLPDIKRLRALHPYYQQLFLQSAQAESLNGQPTAIQELLLKKGVPITWLHLGLANGLYASYPGKTGYFPEFDPRQAPWYQLAAHQSGIHWGNPYVDSQGQGLVLPCAVSLYDRQQHFRGVAALELTFNFIIKSWMSIANVPAIEQTYLLDPKGHIMIRSSDKKKKYGLRFGEEAVNQALELTAFPQAELVQAVQERRSGHLEYRQDGRNRLLVFYPMSTLGWYYVVAAESDKIFQNR